MAQWTTVADWRKTYANAPSDEGVAALVLSAAQEQCETYAPALAPDAAVPARYSLAVQLQARELYQAGRRDNGDTIGADGYVVRVRPLGGQVRQLLRPSRVIGVIR